MNHVHRIQADIATTKIFWGKSFILRQKCSGSHSSLGVSDRESFTPRHQWPGVTYDGSHSRLWQRNATFTLHLAGTCALRRGHVPQRKFWFYAFWDCFWYRFGAKQQVGRPTANLVIVFKRSHNLKAWLCFARRRGNIFFLASYCMHVFVQSLLCGAERYKYCVSSDP